MASPEYASFDFTGYNAEYQRVVSEFSREKAIELITTKLNDKIKIGKKSQNYLGYFTDEAFLKEVESLNLPYLKIEGKNYLYIVTDALSNANRETARKTVKKLLTKREYPISSKFDYLFDTQEWRYIKIVSGLNP